MELDTIPRDERIGVAPAVPTGAIVTPFQLLAHAMNTGADLERLEKLMELQQRYEADQARKAFNADMAEFKKVPVTIVKDKAVGYENKDGNFTGYKHATLGNVTATIVDALAKHGFTHRWDVLQDGPQIIVTCILTHKQGHSESTRMHAVKDDSGKKNALQQVASTVTYLQRYTLLAATGCATQDQDDDGKAAGLDTELADEWLGYVAGAKSAEELNNIWIKGTDTIATAGDAHAYREFKDAVNKRKVALGAAPATGKASRMADIVGRAQKSQPAAEEQG